jgi:hypothetical protein
MYWKNGKTTTFNTTFAEDSQEVLEVVNAHLRRYSQASYKQIHLLKVFGGISGVFMCRTYISANALDMMVLFLNMKSC